MKHFTESDVTSLGSIPNAGVIYCDRTELVYAPLPWQERGLTQTASGYGRKLTSSLKICYEGKLYRIYVTCFSNSGSSWFVVKGKKIFVN